MPRLGQCEAKERVKKWKWIVEIGELLFGCMGPSMYCVKDARGRTPNLPIKSADFGVEGRLGQF